MRQLVTAVLIVVHIANSLSGLPARPSYSFARGRFGAQKSNLNNQLVNTISNQNETTSLLQSTPIEDKSIVSDDREQLYGAYNALHSLAQDFKKPFDSPAVLVVGHQTIGKSALLEAIMGFQFNQACYLMKDTKC